MASFFQKNASVDSADVFGKRRQSSVFEFLCILYIAEPAFIDAEQTRMLVAV